MWIPKASAFIRGRRLFEARPLLGEIRLKAFKWFCKTLIIRCLTGFWISLCLEPHASAWHQIVLLLRFTDDISFFCSNTYIQQQQICYWNFCYGIFRQVWKHISTSSVNALDIKLILKNGKNIYTKPTDAHLYCKHVILFY